MMYCRTCKHQLPSVMKHCVCCAKHRGHLAWDYGKCPDWEEGNLTKREMDEFAEWLEKEML